MRYTYLLLAMFILPQFLRAQTNYKPGSVITNQGDTLKGFINYREWDMNPESIDFKTDINSKEVKQFTLANAQGFNITGLDVYRLHRLKISTDKADVNNLPNGIDTSSTVKKMFLLRLATGNNVTLYSYNDKIKIRFFIQERNGKPYELLYHLFNSPNREQTVVRDRYYQLQLTRVADRFMPDNEALINEINKADYQQNALVYITDMLNGSTKKNVHTVSALRLFVGAGASFTKLSFHRLNVFAPYGKSTANISSPVAPVISFGADFLRNVDIRKILIRTELSFNVAPYKMDAPDGVYKNVRYDEKFTQINTTFSPQLIYNFYRKPRVMVYFNAGINFNAAIYANEGQTATYKDLDTTTPVAGIKDHFNNVWYSFTGKVGVLFNKRYELQAGYMPSTSISNDILSAYQSAIQVGFHYILGKRQ